MNSNVIPTGWAVDREDTSVGIFGDDYIHEACERSYVQGVTLTETDITRPLDGGYLAVAYALECLDCGARVQFELAEFVGSDVSP